MEGWIKLHRKILGSKYGKNLELRGLFDSLVLMANFKDSFVADGTHIKRGQFMTSVLKLSEEFSQSETKMRRMLQKLKSAKQIEIKSSRKNSIITIINYDEYQGHDEQSGEQAADERRTGGDQAETNKNDNNNNNEKNIIKASPLSELFSHSPEIQTWLNNGSHDTHKILLSKFPKHILEAEVMDMYIWAFRNKMKAESWMYKRLLNKNLNVKGSNQAQKSFKRKGVGIDPTPENPTGDPYLQEAIERGLVS